MRKGRTGNQAGSLWAYSLLHGDGQGTKKAPAHKRELTPQEEWDKIKAEHEAEFITLEVATTPYEKSITGKDTKTIEVDRKSYESKMGITELRKIWSSSVAEVQKMVEDTDPLVRVKMIDPLVNFPKTIDGKSVPMTDENVQRAMEQGQAFLDSKNLSEEDKGRLALFVGIASDSNSLIDITNPEIWQIAYDRLQSLEVIKQTTQTPQRVPDQSADELKEVAERDYLENQAGPLWSSLMDYFAQSFQFHPNDLQKKALIDYVVDHGLSVLSHESWNVARRTLCKSGVIPDHCRTSDELLAEKFEKGMSREDYIREYNRIHFQEVK